MNTWFGSSPRRRRADHNQPKTAAPTAMTTSHCTTMLPVSAPATVPSPCAA